MIGESPEWITGGRFDREDLVDGWAGEEASSDRRRACPICVGVCELEQELVGPAGLIEGSIRATDVDRTGGIGQ